MTAAIATSGYLPARLNIRPVTLALCTVSINLLALAVPILSLQVYDRILRNHSVETLQVLVIGVCLAIVVDVALRIARAYLIGNNGAAYVHLMSTATMRHHINAVNTGSVNETVAEGLSGIGAVRSMRDFNSGHSLTVAIDLLFVPIYLTLIWYVGGAIVFVPLAVVIAFSIMSGLKGLELKKQLLVRKDLDNERYNFLIRTLNGIHSVKAFAAEYLQLRKYEVFHERSCEANHKLSSISTRSFSNATLFSQIMIALVIATGAYAAVHGYMSTGALIAVMLVSGRIMQPIQRGLMLWVQYQDYVIARDIASQVFEKPLVDKRPAERQPENTGYMRVRDLAFRYDDAEHDVFAHVDLDLRRGESIHIGGAHRSGKSTLIKVLAGVYKPTEGHIVIDDVELDEVTPERIQRNIGYLSHSSTIFRGTIRDNITRFGAIPFADALEVISALGIKHEFSSLPHGFDTRLTGTVSDPISPGVKQMITLLRALVSKPRIVLFDNADMSLDRVSYQRLYRILAAIKPHVALVIVANDQNFISLADRHYRLDGGRLKEDDRGSRGIDRQFTVIEGGAS